MTITLTDGSTVIPLHPDLYWSDENNWHPVEQTAQRTLTGALIVSAAAKVAGRPITLEPEDDTCGWMTYATVVALRNCAAVPGKVMTLTLRGITHSVIFRHQDGGLDARPVKHYNDADNADFYHVTLRFMEL